MSDLFDDAAPRQRLAIGVETGQVMTVLGPVPVEEMGITLMHEHILL
ncbi:MAG: phosphotriesterase-related protein, partial [Mesorhizobium sp.]